MPSKSKQKGNRWERAAAKTLSDWWGQPFVRSPNSGALRWNNVAFTYGDLIPPEDFPCVSECKSYTYKNLLLLLHSQDVGPSSPLGWWAQAQADTIRARSETNRNLFPLLLIKQNRRPTLICLERNFFDRLNTDLPRFTVIRPDLPIWDFTTCLLDDFLQSVSKEQFLLAGVENGEHSSAPNNR